ncbi:glycerophosphodiester phosphodiesterase [Rhizobium sp. Leaf384]|uniref:glycerophosphodiester phosphodiesterase n=1 Tax=unclassified Rhizobium TaxID=2613769 RepID=UPI0007145B2D|nr:MULTISPECIES: glycerophosphodiester phosphodiesterase family protein [unclassified Rhizobium]KQS80869.1 glycerophosphodiester phosphodiesterase [Rhizobium sp. Leaf384]KQS86729.1 glycerophosphodiester phosphodiesterase [Rhizobium sp. Leaf383]
MPNPPISIEQQGHRTLLKWHRARRKASDPAFSPRRILEGMQLGASVEVDLVLHADHGFAILHDPDLHPTTTGTGRVSGASAQDLRRLFLRGNDGAPTRDRVMLLDDLCDVLQTASVHPGAVLQLDLKEDRSSLPPAVIANFARAVSPFAAAMILSGGDSAAMAALAAATPGLKIGYDPTYPGILDDLTSAEDHMAFIRRALRQAPDAGMIYLDHALVLAAEAQGVDMIGIVHADGRRVDAWTIQSVTPATLDAVRRLLALRVDQITTDDPEGLAAAFADDQA